ncbi:hypothetical protein ERX35_004295 [Macrococcus equipercicus]|uniref:Rhodanese domain-containing protein n=1 Tax=Macrococcus equipercicus TaxID=69967 RepID=A0ABQ6RA53_9STAP|nr:rhodanese-like domain-containing protein [Macrococcus equipercicus]KAA1040216.1 hypothetical protein ERX35_004295 [Macrococcus equipercicus]
MKVWIDSEEFTAEKHQLFDCRNVMDNLAASIKRFNESHMEGAVFVPGYPLLYSKDKPEEGRHPLPDLTRFYTFVTHHAAGKTAVCYDESAAFMAARFFFLCELVGIPCLIIRQGYEALALPEAVSHLEPAGYVAAVLALTPVHPARIHTELLASREEVRQARTSRAQLVDAREEKRFLGETEPIDVHPGRIPGAVNFPYKNVFASHGAEKLQATVGESPAIVYCGSGMSATPLFAALKSVGHPVKLYPGSYSEWIFHHPEDIERG